jgi:AcrR family transcriptional regulator
MDDMESEIRETKSAERAVGGETHRRALSRELLLRTALSIVDEEGLESLTLRALGRRLGVSQTAVYRHIPDKAALLDGIAEQIWRDVVAGLGAGSDVGAKSGTTAGATVDMTTIASASMDAADGADANAATDAEAGAGSSMGTGPRRNARMHNTGAGANGFDFRQFVHDYALSLRSTLLQHPNTAVLMATHPISTPEQYRLIADVLRSVASASSSASDAIRQPDRMLADLTGLIQSVTVLTIGYVIAEVTKPAGGAGGEPSEAAMHEAMLQSEELQQFLAPLADPERTWSMGREFERALNAMLAGWGIE